MQHSTTPQNFDALALNAAINQVAALLLISESSLLSLAVSATRLDDQALLWLNILNGNMSWLP